MFHSQCDSPAHTILKTVRSASMIRSVPAAVGYAIRHNEPILTCIKLRIVNYHALAALIKSQIQDLTGKETTINTLVLAIKRFSDKLPAEKGNTITPNALKGARITLASDMADVTIRPKNAEFPAILKKIANISPKLSTPPDVLKSSKLITLIAEESEYSSIIRPELNRNRIEREQKGLSRLTVHLSPEQARKKDPGFQLFISELLYSRGVKVLHSYIDEDTIIIIDQGEGSRAFAILEEEITFANRHARKPPRLIKVHR
jgi:hypothetical protein